MNKDQAMLVLTKEPFVGYMPTDIEELLYEGMPEEMLSLIFVHVANKAGSLFCDLNENDEWTTYTFHAWEQLHSRIMDMIFDIFLKEGALTEIPVTGKYYALMPFMNRYGYCCPSGWWIPIESEKSPGS